MEIKITACKVIIDVVVAGDCISTPNPKGKTPAYKHPFCLKLNTPLYLKDKVVVLQAQEGWATAWDMKF